MYLDHVDGMPLILFLGNGCSPVQNSWNLVVLHFSTVNHY
jgi:hypothetical protein